MLTLGNIPLESVLASAPLMAELVIEGCTLQILTFPTNEKILEVCPRLNSLLIVNCTTKQIDLSQLNSETALKKLSISTVFSKCSFKQCYADLQAPNQVGDLKLIRTFQ